MNSDESNQSSQSLALCISSTSDKSTSSNESLPDENNKRKKRSRILWKLVKTFTSHDEAVAALSDQWLQFNSYPTREGTTVCYRCKENKKCPARCNLIYLECTGSISMVENNKDHDHTSEDQNHGISKEVKKIIHELYLSGITRPLNIIYALRNRKITKIPSQRQISNYKVKLVTELHGSSNISYADMEEWCKEKRFNFTMTQHSAFVLDYKFSGHYFNICFTTKYLLSLAINASCIVIDATYKLNFQGFPLIVSGMIDLERQFHPFIVSLSADESTESYEFHFRTIKVIFTHFLHN